MSQWSQTNKLCHHENKAMNQLTRMRTTMKWRYNNALLWEKSRLLQNQRKREVPLGDGHDGFNDLRNGRRYAPLKENKQPVI